MKKNRWTKQQETVPLPEIHHYPEEIGPSSEMQRYLEWQEKQYLPGYYVGGRIPPIFYGKRPNKYGYLLLITGSFTLIALLFMTWADFATGMAPETIGPRFIAALVGVLQIVSGWRLLQRPKMGKG